MPATQKKVAIGVVAGVLALLAFAPAYQPPRAKTRPQRISTVNSVRSVTFVLTGTTSAPAGTPVR
jgi:hypothetical protein